MEDTDIEEDKCSEETGELSISISKKKAEWQSSISKKKANWLISQAGELMPEDPDQIRIDKNEHLLSDKVHAIILEVIKDHAIPFKLQDFQLLTLHCLGNFKNVILVSPTGSGKMLCAYLGLEVIKRVCGNSKGVGVGTMPLSALMEEKLKNPLVKTGLITMSGYLKRSEHESDAALTASIEDFKKGEIQMILGHPESWLTATAKEILKCLSKDGLIVFSFVDEFQMNLSKHWGKDFR